MKDFFTAIGVLVAFVVCVYGSADAQEKKETLSPQPGQSQADVVESSYVIGPEDVLSIHVWREDALSRTVPVRMDGKITLPLVDDIQAAGHTPQQLKEMLTEKLKRFIDNPNVSVTVMEANSFKVFVSGQVRTPGVVLLRRETTIMQLIPMVGGFTDWADQKKIVVVRNESGKEKRITVNYKKISKGEALESNIVLKAGDIIIVP